MSRRRVRMVVPLRRVFPWWYLAGSAVTIGVLSVLDDDVSPGVAAFWGPVVGIAIRERQLDAARRQDGGRSVERRDLVGPWWLEPVLAAIMTMIGVGLALALRLLLGGQATTLRWIGVGVLAAGVLAVLVLAAAVRRRRDRDQRRADDGADPEW